jgi:hypothetical protein
MKSVRRTGRTTRMVKRAVNTLLDGEHIVLVGWNHPQALMLLEYVEKELKCNDFYRYLIREGRLRAMSYECYLGSKWRENEGVKFFIDHHVEEMLHVKNGGTVEEQVNVILDIDGFRKTVAIPVDHYMSGRYRIMITEPLAAFCVHDGAAENMTTLDLKTVTFGPTGERSVDDPWEVWKPL